jgi:hypothetical protein
MGQAFLSQNSDNLSIFVQSVKFNWWTTVEDDRDKGNFA